MNTTTIKMNDEICTISFDITKEDYSSKQKHTILHVSTPFDPEELKYSGITKKPEPSRKGEDPDNDKLWRQYNRAELQIEKRIIQQAVRDGLISEEMGRTAKWSRKAGCSCGCSPGWKIRDYGRRTIWLHCTAPSKEKEKLERQLAYQSEREAEKLFSMVI